ncbi:Uncharacterised protein [Vibrio cholerae]|nr:Uncharacterised protein [Vibrio cholerae]
MINLYCSATGICLIPTQSNLAKTFESLSSVWLRTTISRLISKRKISVLTTGMALILQMRKPLFSA